MISIVKDNAGNFQKSKEGKYIFTNGNSYFTLSLSEFKQLRANMADVEKEIEQAEDRAYYESRTKTESI